MACDIRKGRGRGRGRAGLRLYSAVLPATALLTAAGRWGLAAVVEKRQGLAASDAKNEPIVSLALVFLQTFAVILVGYGAARSDPHILAKAESIRFIVGGICLPLLVFRAVATADFSAVHAGVVVALSGSKLLIQCGTALFSAWLAPPGPGKKLLNAGLYSFYVTASDDFALGYPVISAVFPIESYPQNFLAYLTAVAVVQTVVMNSFSLGMLEAGKAQQEQAGSLSGSPGSPSLRLHKTVLLNIGSNPLVGMTVVGLLYKCLFGWTVVRTATGARRLPMGLEDVVSIMTSPFRFLALFQVGMRVGTLPLGQISSVRWMAISALNLLKVVATPIIMVTMLKLTVHGLSREELSDFEQFAFICGSLPTSAAPVVFAGLYDMSVKVVAPAVPTGLVLGGTVMSITAIVASVVQMPELDADEGTALQVTLQVVAIVSAALVAVLLAAGVAAGVERSWCRWFFFYLALTSLATAAAQLALLRADCDLPAAVYVAESVFRHQGRLLCVLLPWLLIYCRGTRPRPGFFHAAWAAICLPPVLLVLPAAIGLAAPPRESLFPYGKCLYVRGEWECVLDQVFCGLCLLALLGALSVGRRLRTLGQFEDAVHASSPTTVMPRFPTVDVDEVGSFALPQRAASPRPSGRADAEEARPRGGGHARATPQHSPGGGGQRGLSKDGATPSCSPLLSRRAFGTAPETTEASERLVYVRTDAGEGRSKNWRPQRLSDMDISPRRPRRPGSPERRRRRQASAGGSSDLASRIHIVAAWTTNTMSYEHMGPLEWASEELVSSPLLGSRSPVFPVMGIALHCGLMLALDLRVAQVAQGAGGLLERAVLSLFAVSCRAGQGLVMLLMFYNGQSLVLLYDRVVGWIQDL